MIIFVCDIYFVFHFSSVYCLEFVILMLLSPKLGHHLLNVFQFSNCLPFPKPVATGIYLPHLNLVFFVAICFLVVVACLVAKKGSLWFFLCVFLFFLFLVAKKTQAPCCIHHISGTLQQRKGGHHRHPPPPLRPFLFLEQLIELCKRDKVNN